MLRGELEPFGGFFWVANSIGLGYGGSCSAVYCVMMMMRCEITVIPLLTFKQSNHGMHPSTDDSQSLKLPAPLAGKTTFIKNMFASYAQDADLKINDVSAPTSKDEFVHSPEKLCTEIVVSDPTTQTRYIQVHKR